MIGFFSSILVHFFFFFTMVIFPGKDEHRKRMRSLSPSPSPKRARKIPNYQLVVVDSVTNCDNHNLELSFELDEPAENASVDGFSDEEFSVNFDLLQAFAILRSDDNPGFLTFLAEKICDLVSQHSTIQSCQNKECLICTDFLLPTQSLFCSKGSTSFHGAHSLCLQKMIEVKMCDQFFENFIKHFDSSSGDNLDTLTSIINAGGILLDLWICPACRDSAGKIKVLINPVFLKNDKNELFFSWRAIIDDIEYVNFNFLVKFSGLSTLVSSGATTFYELSSLDAYALAVELTMRDLAISDLNEYDKILLKEKRSFNAEIRNANIQIFHQEYVVKILEKLFLIEPMHKIQNFIFENMSKFFHCDHAKKISCYDNKLSQAVHLSTLGACLICKEAFDINNKENFVYHRRCFNRFFTQEFNRNVIMYLHESASDVIRILLSKERFYEQPYFFDGYAIRFKFIICNDEICRTDSWPIDICLKIEKGGYFSEARPIQWRVFVNNSEI